MLVHMHVQGRASACAWRHVRAERQSSGAAPSPRAGVAPVVADGAVGSRRQDEGAPAGTRHRTCIKRRAAEIGTPSVRLTETA
eukprot:2745873-Pleurochrysis_carterae.AAC.2